jgi:uncharacterized protein (DUF2141 family)
MARFLNTTWLWLGVTCLSTQLLAGGAPAAKTAEAAPVAHYDRSQFFGEPVYDAAGKLQYVAENKSQTHSKDNYVMVRVKNIKKADARKTGRIRVALWNAKETFAKEGVKPFRAVSHWAKDTVNDEMLFKIGGLTLGENLAFFAHFDELDTGKVARGFLGIPKEQFIFSNTKNQGMGPGLTREGLSAPKFESTLVKYLRPGQEIVLTLK